MERKGGRERRQLNFSCQFYSLLFPYPVSQNLDPMSLLYAVHRRKGYGDRKGSEILPIGMQFEIR